MTPEPNSSTRVPANWIKELVDLREDVDRAENSYYEADFNRGPDTIAERRRLWRALDDRLWHLMHRFVPSIIEEHAALLASPPAVESSAECQIADYAYHEHWRLIQNVRQYVYLWANGVKPQRGQVESAWNAVSELESFASALSDAQNQSAPPLPNGLGGGE